MISTWTTLLIRNYFKLQIHQTGHSLSCTVEQSPSAAEHWSSPIPAPSLSRQEGGRWFSLPSLFYFFIPFLSFLSLFHNFFPFSHFPSFFCLFFLLSFLCSFLPPFSFLFPSSLVLHLSFFKHPQRCKQMPLRCTTQAPLGGSWDLLHFVYELRGKSLYG